jgi:membrane protein required for colicin V production
MPINIISKLNWVDILIVTVVLRISYVAYKDGLSHEIFPLIGSVGTAVLSLHYYRNLSQYIYQNAVKLPMRLLDFLSFVILLIVIGLIFKLLRVISDKIIKVTWHPLVEKAGGLIVGFARGSVVVSILLVILSLMPLSYLQWSIRDRSLMGMGFLRIVPGIYARVSGALPTFRVETSAANADELVKTLAADKSIKLRKTEGSDTTMGGTR